MRAALAGALLAVAVLAAVPPAEAREARTGPRLAATCMFSHASHDDPMFHPGTTGHGHEHLFYGNRTTDAHSTLGSLLGGETLCKRPADRSAKWGPAVRKGGTEARAYGRLVVYYNTTPGLPQRGIRPLPPGAMLVARDDSGPGRVEWRCAKGPWRATAPHGCRSRTFAARVTFPQCWNGERRPVLGEEAGAWSVVAAGKNRCPRHHPVQLPRITAQFTYTLPHATGGAISVSAGEGEWKGAGFMHANYVAAWQGNVQEKLVRECLHNTRDGERRPTVCRTNKG